MLDSAINHIASALEQDPPQASDKGVYTFELKDEKSLHVSTDKQDQILLFTPVGNPFDESEESEKLIQKALQWQFIRLKDYTDTLTWEPDNHQLHLYRQIHPSELADQPIVAQIESFLNSMEFWNTALENPDASNSPFSM